MARQRGSRWQGLVKIRGQQVSRTFATEAEAKAWEDRERLKYADSTFSAKLGRVSVQTAADVWLEVRKSSVAASTYATDSVVIGLLPSALLKRQIRGVKPQDLQLLVDSWRAAKSVATVRRYCDCLCAFFKWSARRGYVVSDPMEAVEIPRRKKTMHAISPMTEDQIEAMAKGLRDFDAAVVRVLAHSGLRWGEARALRVADVQLTSNPPHIQVKRSQPEGKPEKAPKSGRMRVVPLAKVLVPVVEELSRGKTGDDYLLSRNGKSQIWRGRFTRSTKWEEISGGRTIHDLRHSAACNWLRRGVPVNVVQSWLGHADLETTAIYTTYLGMGIDLAAYERMNG